MAVSMSAAEGVTVFTLTSDPQSRCPPLCQILKGLCYSPFCCSVSRQLRGFRRNSQSVLGALRIMVGLLNIGLGAILCSSGSASAWHQMRHLLFSYWLGGVFIFFGVVCILSEKFPSPCLILLNVMLSVAGVAFAIAAIVLYSVNIAKAQAYWLCDRSYSYYNTQSPSLREDSLMEKCLEGKKMMIMLLRSINGLLIALSVLELCVVISAGVLGIKALRRSMKTENETIDDPEQQKPLLEEISINTSA